MNEQLPLFSPASAERVTFDMKVLHDRVDQLAPDLTRDDCMRLSGELILLARSLDHIERLRYAAVKSAAQRLHII